MAQLSPDSPDKVTEATRGEVSGSSFQHADLGSPQRRILTRSQPLTIILRATPSSCDASSRMRWAILSGGPPSGAGRDRCAKTLLPETKWS